MWVALSLGLLSVKCQVYQICYFLTNAILHKPSPVIVHWYQVRKKDTASICWYPKTLKIAHAIWKYRVGRYHFCSISIYKTIKKSW